VVTDIVVSLLDTVLALWFFYCFRKSWRKSRFVPCHTCWPFHLNVARNIHGCPYRLSNDCSSWR